MQFPPFKPFAYLHESISANSDNHYDFHIWIPVPMGVELKNPPPETPVRIGDEDVFEITFIPVTEGENQEEVHHLYYKREIINPVSQFVSASISLEENPGITKMIGKNKINYADADTTEL